MERKDITEIYVNDDGYIRYQSYKEGKVKTDLYMSPNQIQAIIEILAGQVGKVVNEGKRIRLSARTIISLMVYLRWHASGKILL